MSESSLFDPIEGDRAVVWFRLGAFIESARLGRVDLYWYSSARQVAGQRPELQSEFKDVWARALDLAKGIG